MNILKRFTERLVGDIDWFFQDLLVAYYENRRNILSGYGYEGALAIDYIISKSVNENVIYPPKSASQWHELFSKSVVLTDRSPQSAFQQILIIYLKLDLNHHISLSDSMDFKDEKDSRLKKLKVAAKEISSLDTSFSFPLSTINLATGLWAIDNGQNEFGVRSLSDSKISMDNYFLSPQELVKIVIEILIATSDSRLALHLSKTYQFDNSESNYDPTYATLLISCGQLSEALKYERLFADQKGYQDILQNFFESGSKCGVVKSLNRLKLSNTEEEVWNQLSPNYAPPSTIAETMSTNPSPQPISRTSSRNENRRPTKRSSSKSKADTLSATGMNTSSKIEARRTPKFSNSRNRIIRSELASDSPARNTRSARKKVVSK